MKLLKAGDVRQKGDLVRHLDLRTGYNNRQSPIYVPMKGKWEQVNLIGYPILRSDLMVAEFQRP